MNWLTNKIRQFYHKDVDGTGLALFRISICMCMLLELMHSIYFKKMMFVSANMLIPLGIWGVVIVLIMVGAFTRIMTIVNYALCMIIINQQIHNYHMDYAYFGVSFLFLFLPVSRKFSIDNLIRSLKYSSTKYIYRPPLKVSSLAYYLPLLVGSALIYFESALNWKVISPIWMRGLGMWLPGSTPYLVHADLSFILNYKYLNLICGYLTIVFEIAFIFLMWFKRFRYILTIVGLGLHLGILIFFPIPLFAVGMSCYYFLLFPNGFWRKKASSADLPAKTILKVYYDSERLSSVRARIIFEHFDLFGNIEFMPVQDNAKDGKNLINIPQDKLLSNIYGIGRSGKVYEGIDTYIKILCALRYTYPLAVILRIPGIYQLAKYINNRIATYKYSKRSLEISSSTIIVPQPLNFDDRKIIMNYTIADFKIDFIKYGLITLMFLQFCISWDRGLMSKISDGIGIHENFILRKFGLAITTPARILFGLGSHAVYMDYAYYGYEIKIVYKDKMNRKQTLPMIKDNGLAGGYLYGPNYVNFLFYCANKNAVLNGNDMVSKLDETSLNYGLNSWVDFWAKKNNIKSGEGIFLVDLKEFKIFTKWEKDALKSAMKQPWQQIGKFVWSENDDIKIEFNELGRNKLGQTIVNDL